jgi:hypothetical protein
MPAIESPESTGWSRSDLFNLLSVSGTLAGLCITIVAFINLNGKGPSTIVDDVLVLCAAVFVTCIYLIVWSLRHFGTPRAAFLVRIVDVLFLAALTVMTAAGAIMVYTIW